MRSDPLLNFGEFIADGAPMPNDGRASAFQRLRWSYESETARSSAASLS